MPGIPVMFLWVEIAMFHMAAMGFAFVCVCVRVRAFALLLFVL